jgi:2-hydroxy-3-oxopropionate reductase
MRLGDGKEGKEKNVSDTVGFVGLGLMGSAMSHRLLQNGYRVVGFDLVPKRMRDLENVGGESAASVADAVRRAGPVVLSLPNSRHHEEIVSAVGGILEGAHAKTLILDTTTTHPRDTRCAAEMLSARDVSMLDASISGNSVRAAEGNLTFLVGGTVEAFAKGKPLLEALGKEIIHVGDSGSGAQMKLVVQLISATTRVALAEALTFGKQAGLDPEQIMRILPLTNAHSRQHDFFGPRMVQGAFEEPPSRLRQFMKDIDLVIEGGQSFGTPLLLTSICRELFRAAAADGGGDLDSSSVIRVYQKLGGMGAGENVPNE